MLSVISFALTLLFVGPGSAQSPAQAVQIDVYYETLCPDSIRFITTQLYPTWQSIGQILNVTLVPYGKATEVPVNGQWRFKCQHGPRECAGNLIQTCAINLLTAAPQQEINTKLLDFINCMEDSSNPPNAGQTCADKYNIDYSAIKQCTMSKQGNDWQHIMAKKTEGLNPELNYVPWIVVNGQHTKESQQHAEYDLHDYVCGIYNGPKPAGCN